MAVRGVFLVAAAALLSVACSSSGDGQAGPVQVDSGTSGTTDTGAAATDSGNAADSASSADSRASDTETAHDAPPSDGTATDAADAAPTCVPESKDTRCAGHLCATVSDGCSGTYFCGSGVNTCPAAAACGTGADSKCGTAVDCGTCPFYQTCGFSTANQCGGCAVVADDHHLCTTPARPLLIYCGTPSGSPAGDHLAPTSCDLVIDPSGYHAFCCPPTG